MEAHFDRAYAFRTSLAATPSGASVDLKVVFSNTAEDKSVTLKWYASKVISGSPVYAPAVTEVETTAYLPTATCQFASTSTKIYVAGWSRRLKACVIEEWAFGTGAFVTTTHPVTGEVSASFVPPTVTKSLLFSSATAIAAIEGMACHPVSGFLYLLEEGPDANVHRFDPATGEMTLIMNGLVTGPELFSAASVRLLSHANSPYLLGFLNQRNWAVKPATEYFIVLDSDGDGAIEVGSAAAYDQIALLSAFPTEGYIPVLGF